MELICRICLKDVKPNLFRSINEKSTKTSSITLKQRLKICVPEIKLEVTNDPIICDVCYDDLQQAYDFKKKCLQTEEKVKTHMKKMKYRTCFKISEIAYAGRENVDITPDQNTSKKMAVGNGGATIEFVDLSAITGNTSGSSTTNAEKRKLVPLMEETDGAAKKGRFDEPESILPDSKPKTVMPVILEAKSLASLSETESILPIVLSKPETENNYSVTVDKSIILPSKPKKDENKTPKPKSKTIIVYENDNEDDETSPNDSNSVHNSSEVANEDEASNLSSTASDAGSTSSENNNLYETTKDGMVVCTICCVITASVDAVKSHQRSNHSRLMCFICDKLFKNLVMLRAHNKIHENSREFQCKECKKTCADKNSLRVHMSQHTGYRPFNCPYCPKTYVTKGNLKTHVKSYHKIVMTDTELEKCENVLANTEETTEEEQVQLPIAEAVYLPVKTEAEEIPEDVPNFIDVDDLRRYTNPTS